MSLFDQELDAPEQLKMPDVMCPTCGQHWPAPAPRTEAPEYEIRESAPMVTRMPDGTIVTTEVIMKIEPAPPEIETGESNGSERSA